MVGQSPATAARSAVPRHRETNDFLRRKICRLGAAVQDGYDVRPHDDEEVARLAELKNPASAAAWAQSNTIASIRAITPCFRRAA
jgi:hypothetical protein